MKKFMMKLMSTSNDSGAMIARLVLGAVMLPHGLQKLVGAFGGYGFTATFNSFTSMGMPAVFAFLVIMAESLGAMALILGLVGRFMAFGIFAVMTGAIFMVHIHHGFFASDGGIEYHLLAIGLALIVMLRGSGKFSIDLALMKKK